MTYINRFGFIIRSTAVCEEIMCRDIIINGAAMHVLTDAMCV